MTETEKRRFKILETLKESSTPQSGTELAKKFGVSRQVIVQDIALLKAEEHPIISTNRGYQLVIENSCEKIFKVFHRDEDIITELNAIVDLGAIVKDVFVKHKVYGVLEAEMNIKSRRDVKRFMDRITSGVSSPLKSLTKNYHYHTIVAESEEILMEVEDTLRNLGFLVEVIKI